MKVLSRRNEIFGYLLVKSHWCCLSCDSDLQPAGYEVDELPLLHSNLTKTDIASKGFILLSADLILTKHTGKDDQEDQSLKASYQDHYQHVRINRERGHSILTANTTWRYLQN